MSTVVYDTAQVHRKISSRIVRYVTIAVAAILGAGFMDAIWRKILGIPLELSVGVHMNDVGSAVRPWAPWWVPVTISAILAMLLWRVLAARAGRISALGGTFAFAAVAVLSFPIAFLCLEFGAIAQFNPSPPLDRILMVLPLMAVAALTATVMNLLFHGLALVPLAALLGLLNAGLGKSILWIGRRLG